MGLFDRVPLGDVIVAGFEVVALKRSSKGRARCPQVSLRQGKGNSAAPLTTYVSGFLSNSRLACFWHALQQALEKAFRKTRDARPKARPKKHASRNSLAALTSKVDE